MPEYGYSNREQLPNIIELCRRSGNPNTRSEGKISEKSQPIINYGEKPLNILINYQETQRNKGQEHIKQHRKIEDNLAWTLKEKEK